MTELAVKTYSLKEYLELESAGDQKYEFHDGYITAMAGGTLKHGQIQTNLSREVSNALIRANKSCSAYSSDVKVAIDRANRYFYPDLSVVCGESHTSPWAPHGLANPLLIVEVLSEGTEAFDRGRKFFYYPQIDSLREYVLISQESAMVDVYFRREDDIWQLQSYSGATGAIPLQALGIEISLEEIYRGVAGLVV